MDALRQSYPMCGSVPIDVLHKEPDYQRQDYSDTDSTGASEHEREGKCIYSHNCDDLRYTPYVTVDGLICHADNEVIGTTRASLSRESTLFVWDWDDTLFPSSWINMQGMRLDDDFQPSDLQRAELDALAAQVLATLEVASEHGEMIIITNAEEGWVPLSCNKFMPQLMSTVEKFRVISARTRYETVGVFSPLTWKMRCFEHEITDHFEKKESSRGYRNVISLGDSIHEREAMIRVARDMPCGSKTVKLQERPTVQDLITGHELMRRTVPTLAQHDGDLDLAVRVDTRAVVFYN